MKCGRLYKNFSNRWIRFWMRYANLTNFGRFSMRIAAWIVPLQSKGPIIIGDEALLGVNVTVLNGVNIGKGAEIGAGSVVAHNIPDGAVAVAQQIIQSRL